VDLAELFDCLRNCLFDRFGLAHISSDRNRFTAICVDRIRSRLQVLNLATRNRDTRTRFSKSARDAASDTRSTTRHKRHAPIKNSLTKNRFTHCSDPCLSCLKSIRQIRVTLIASSNLNLPSYRALPTMTLSRRESPASRNRLISSRL